MPQSTHNQAHARWYLYDIEPIVDCADIDYDPDTADYYFRFAWHTYVVLPQE